MKELQLSRNFKLSEFTRSEVADKYGIDNNPPDEVVERLSILVTELLQPLRNIYGHPLHINSGYRSLELNDKLRELGYNSSTTSQHLSGEAADVRCEDPESLVALIEKSQLNYDQIGVYNKFLHISYRLANNRHNVFFNNK